MKNWINILCCSAMALQSCNFGIGAAGIFGGSYIDPVGVQVSIEPKLVELNKNSSLAGGLGFSLQGGAYREDDFSGDVQLGYITLPMVYNYTGNKGWYGEIGLQPAYNIIARDKYGGNSYDFKEGASDFDLGIPAGFGYQFKNGLCVGVRGTYGLLAVEKGGSGTHNYIVAGMIKYNFDWKKWFKKK